MFDLKYRMRIYILYIKIYKDCHILKRNLTYKYHPLKKYERYLSSSRDGGKLLNFEHFFEPQRQQHDWYRHSSLFLLSPFGLCPRVASVL